MLACSCAPLGQFALSVDLQVAALSATVLGLWLLGACDRGNGHGALDCVAGGPLGKGRVGWGRGGGVREQGGLGLGRCGEEGCMLG
eukprot:34675-Pelagomonas_calceolata.AAC.2